MSEEIKDLLFLLHNDRLTEAGKRKLEQEIERLNNIIKGLDNTIENLEEVVEHKDNIIKEVREYINDSHVSITQLEAGTGILDTKDYVLEILNKEGNSDE